MLRCAMLDVTVGFRSAHRHLGPDDQASETGARTGVLIMRWIAGLILIMSHAAALAQQAPSEAVPYCADLKRVAALASARDRFASITGKPREGNFSETTLPLTGWRDCVLYGAGMYTCDSHGIKGAEEAEKAQAKTADQVLSCFAGTWLELKDRGSPGYTVLHPARGPASITLNIDQDDQADFVVRLNLFIRR
jgi:hypothetical protein